MFEVCLFDLDETLIRTDDLKELRESCKHNDDPERLAKIHCSLSGRGDRHIYTLQHLEAIRLRFPSLKLGVFTRSPRSYAKVALDWAYQGFEWDILVAYEDVGRTKPYGDGIDLVMEKFGVPDLDQVVLVGDSDVDVRSAYHCGCVVALDKGAWPFKWGYEHWGALEHIPDAIIRSPEELLEVLENFDGFLPELERSFINDQPAVGSPRFDKINHFISRAAGGDNKPFPIYVCGRYFSSYDSVRFRRQWHILTESIDENKDSEVFPDQWVNTVRAFIEKIFPRIFGPKNIVVSVIPHRPGRMPRLEHFLEQLSDSLREAPIEGRNISFLPELLGFKEGVRSQHNDYLGRDERFINVRDHLFVKMPEAITPGTACLILDDVTTTGASLIYASKYLTEAGAMDVKCLSMAKNVGRIL